MAFYPQDPAAVAPAAGAGAQAFGRFNPLRLIDCIIASIFSLRNLQCHRADTGFPGTSYSTVTVPKHLKPAFDVGSTSMTPNFYRNVWFHILYRPLPSSKLAMFVNSSLAVVILTNCIAVALETVPSIHGTRQTLFFYLEAISTGLFAVEYCLRVWTCVEQPRFANPILGRIKYAIQPLPLLDLIVVCTYFAPFDLRFLRIFRLVRLVRVLALEEFDKSVRAIWAGIEKRKYLLFASVTFMLVAVYFTAALLYVVEHAAQPKAFSSIPETLWWAVVTLTTIGYGDVVPITPVGKILTGTLAIIGIGIFALPASIVTAAILDAGSDRSTRCPHCGQTK